jgi:hypothetical protein
MHDQGMSVQQQIVESKSIGNASTVQSSAASLPLDPNQIVNPHRCEQIRGMDFRSSKNCKASSHRRSEGAEIKQVLSYSGTSVLDRCLPREYRAQKVKGSRVDFLFRAILLHCEGSLP